MNIETLKKEFSARANEEKANHLVGYMRNQFLFYGLQTPERRAIYHNFLKDEKKKKEVDWKLLDQAWDEEQREVQYFACDYLLAMKKYIVFDDLAKIERFVRTKQWWDTIDSSIKIYGYVGLTDNRVDDLMLKWSQDPDFWVRRVAIEHQLLRKNKMNTALLQKIIENNLDNQEFFINKAIGWALRDYSKTNPDWVRNFIELHREHIAKLSIKEGSKYL